MLARIYVTLKPGVLDPQGQAVRRSLGRLGFGGVEDVRVGKYLEVRLEAADRDAASKQLDEMCRQLIANTVIEDYRFELVD
ncbi:MAG TPA: phosphoribosylformylglycinamidine synthase subunit PurS [Polyangia bacterium]